MSNENRDNDNDGNIKDALQRDLEQTKADVTGNRAGQDLDQDVDDTLRQAVGKQDVPGENQPNRD
ncbi:MAG TPA: hypothetical protein VMY88_05690 [Acidimicrobiales bacterium]|nr:hypothetical protein [Acidimicrobiales bacterium]